MIKDNVFRQWVFLFMHIIRENYSQKQQI
jgi:TPR repeat protein